MPSFRFRSQKLLATFVGMPHVKSSLPRPYKKCPCQILPKKLISRNWPIFRPNFRIRSQKWRTGVPKTSCGHASCKMWPHPCKNCLSQILPQEIKSLNQTTCWHDPWNNAFPCKKCQSPILPQKLKYQNRPILMPNFRIRRQKLRLGLLKTTGKHAHVKSARVKFCQKKIKYRNRPISGLFSGSQVRNCRQTFQNHSWARPMQEVLPHMWEVSETNFPKKLNYRNRRIFKA